MIDPILAARIYIIDDQAANLRLLERYLGRVGFEDITSFSDPRAALAAIETDEPDLLLLDLHMPGLDGFGVLDALRGHLAADDFLPILVLTGDVERDVRSRALTSGATDFLTKPLDAQEVVLRARNLIRTRQLHKMVRSRLEEGIRESERNLAEAQRIAHIGSWERDLRTDALVESDEACRILGIEPGTFGGSAEILQSQFMHPDDRDRVRDADKASIEAGGLPVFDYRIIRPDGAIRFVHEEGEVIRDEDGAPVRMVGTIQDITEQVAAEEERTRLVSAVEQTADSIMITDADGTISFVNRSFARVYGYRPEDVVGQHARLLRSYRHGDSFYAARFAAVRAGETWSGSIVNRRRDGTRIEVESVVSPIHDATGHLTGYVQADRDTTRERGLERTVERDTRNRESIESALARIDPGSSPEEIAAVTCAEIIRLPGVGYAVAFDLTPGSEVRLAEQGRLAEASGPDVAIPEARFRHLRDRAKTGPWVERWKPRPTDDAYGKRLTASGVNSVAYAPFPGVGDAIGIIGIGTVEKVTAGQLVERLPALSMFASIVGTLIGPGLDARHRIDAERARIQASIDATAFSPFFQPIVEFHTGAVVGYEALSRFADGTRPDVVFASAARVGLGIELEGATLEAALRAAAILPPGATLNLNASPAFIGSDRIGPLLAGLKGRITLEVTEHAVVDDYAELRRELAALGPNVQVAVDDAGAGYASFHHILELAPDVVKLDLGLVRGIDADPARQALIAGMAYFAVKRKIRLIAEGIETAAELQTLRSLGILYGQGYLLGRPQDGRGPGPWPTSIVLPDR